MSKRIRVVMATGAVLAVFGASACQVLDGEGAEPTDTPEEATNAGPLAPVLAGLLKVEPSERLTAENATKMLRIAALAPWAPETDKKTAEQAPAPAEPRPAGPQDGEHESAREQAKEHFRAGAHVLAESINERLRHSPEAMNSIMTSIRESTDTLGLTSSGRHAEHQSRLPVVLMVALGVILLLGLVLWALLGR